MNLCRINNPLNKIKQRLMPAESLVARLQPRQVSQSCNFSNGKYNKVPNSLAQDDKLAGIVDHYLEYVTGMTTWVQTDYQILGPGMLLWKNYLSFRGQVKIVKMCQEYGMRPGGFYKPPYQNGENPHLHMMCFGRNWDPQTKYDVRYRRDGSKAPRIPNKLLSLVKGIVEHSQFHLNSEKEIALPLMAPDVCIVNFFNANGQLDLHQDCDESESSLISGLPVVSVHIGSTVEFIYGRTSDELKAKSVLLESGDVLIFGGKSRHIYHGIKRIIPNSIPMPLREEAMLKPGSLILNFKKV